MIPGNPLEWPKLSEDLPFRGGPTSCQGCEARTTGFRWREHDHMDRPTEVVIVLCERCSNRLIDPHPRLYGKLQRDEPGPGTMPCCEECCYRVGVVCDHPSLKANGGPGLILRFPEPSGPIHVDHKDERGRRRGAWIRVHRGPVECDGRDCGGEA